MKEFLNHKKGVIVAEMKKIAHPRQVILVSTRGKVKSKFSPEEDEKDNLFTLSWHMPVSNEPQLYAISSGKERFSTKLIQESKVFAVNFMSSEFEKEVVYCGTYSGEHIDKFEETGLEKEESEKIDCPRIRQAMACLECEVVNEVEAGDHIIFIGKVINSISKKQGKRIFQMNDRFIGAGDER
ncbi:hypothetical protein GF336_03060 [Candidatus Woesearchaeota archaeon]|nr:hypothetical protein [Candidatus Woesearchaeota archaeon]